MPQKIDFKGKNATLEGLESTLGVESMSRAENDRKTAYKSTGCEGTVGE